MTPEELKAHQDFIIGTLARLTAAQEQERKDRLDFEKAQRENSKEFREWMRRMAEIQAQQANLLVHQSERMDHMNKTHEEFKQDFRRLVHLLNMILDRLPPAVH
ncbi:MAG TPA: hypothetical protein VKY31_04230 [Terriglobia bacterium]|nr:hypothetical protein [Terriglobia bacterium]